MTQRSSPGRRAYYDRVSKGSGPNDLHCDVCRHHRKYHHFATFGKRRDNREFWCSKCPPPSAHRTQWYPARASQPEGPVGPGQWRG